MDYIIQKETEKLIRDFFDKIGLPIDLAFDFGETGVEIKAKTEEPKMLIGQNGQILAEIQHLLRILIAKKQKERFSVDFDVNDYKKKKTEYLKIIAKEAADEVALTGREKSFEPMPSYERRIVHLELADRRNIIAESVGQGLERRIVIKPRPN